VVRTLWGQCMLMGTEVRSLRSVRGAIAWAAMLLALIPAALNGQAPRVFIEGFRVNDSLSRSAAAALRAEVPRHVSRQKLTIMSSSEIQAHRDAGAPDDFGGAWGWTDLREVGRAYRVDAIIDITAVKAEHGVILRTARLRPIRGGLVDTLPTTQAHTLEQAVGILARRLAADSVLLTRRQ
jgi:hypothetical protein